MASDYTVQEGRQSTRSAALQLNPVTDGERLLLQRSYGILAYDWKGKLAWEYPMELSKSPYGSARLPCGRDLVLITRDYPPDPFLLAVQKKDGNWRGKRIW